MSGALARLAAGIYGTAWETRRRVYALGLARPRRVDARVVSIGNLTVGGAGKTTLALHLAREAVRRGLDAAVVCRRYRPGASGEGDEERLFRAALGRERVYAGRSKLSLARAAAAAGRRWLVVDDGFSHWALARDLDVVLLDAQDPWGGGALLPAGRLREPRRALQRARVVVVSRLGAGEDPAPHLESARRAAPGAVLAAARHAVSGARALDGSPAAIEGRVRVVTATGNPGAVARTAREAGFEVVSEAAYRDHHWFDPGEARAEAERARGHGARLLITAKDAVRWPRGAADDVVRVLEVAWEWVTGGERVERLAFEDEGEDA